MASNRWVALAGVCTAAGLVWLAFADLGIALGGLPAVAVDGSARRPGCR